MNGSRILSLVLITVVVCVASVGPHNRCRQGMSTKLSSITLRHRGHIPEEPDEKKPQVWLCVGVYSSFLGKITPRGWWL